MNEVPLPPGEKPHMPPGEKPHMPPGEKPHMFDNPRNVRRVIYALCAACVILFGLDAVIPRHVEHPWEGVFGFYGLYGFGACVLLVLGAKELRKVLMRGEDYYDD